MNIDYSSVASFERAKAPEKRSSSTAVFSILLLVVFFIALMAGLAAGAGMYRSVADTQIATGQARMESGLLASNIRVNDHLQAIGVGNGPEGDSLVLVNDLATGTYETRIYRYEGQIVQEYSRAGTEYTPTRAQPLVTSDTFEFTFQGGLVSITTDHGTTDIALRSEQGGVA